MSNPSTALSAIHQRWAEAGAHDNTAQAGYEAVTGGYSAKVTGGDNAVLRLTHWDQMAARVRVKTAYVGEDGIEPNVPYRLDKAGQFVRADAKKED